MSLYGLPVPEGYEGTINNPHYQYYPYPEGTTAEEYWSSPSYYSSYPTTTGETTGTTTETTDDDLSTLFSLYFPTGEELFPWSSTESSSSSSAWSKSGLTGDYADQLMDMLFPYLEDTITNYIPYIDEYTQHAFDMYGSSMNTTLTEMLPDILAEYGNKGVLSSTVMSDALGKTQTELARDMLTKQYETAMNAAIMKAINYPALLGSLMEYGKVSEMESTSGSSTTSYQEDPTAMYAIIAELLKGLM